MPLQWIEDPRVFAAHRDAWDRLHAADPDATFFHTAEYLKLYWEEFGKGPPLVALVTDGDRPSALCSFQIRDGVLGFLGGYEVTDYMGPVGREDARGTAAKELMGGLAARDDWERGDLEGLLEEASWLQPLREAAAAAGLSVEVAEDDVAPMLDLPGSWEEYLAGLGAKQRHEIRRKERRVRETFEDVRLTASTPETLDDDLDRFVGMHRSSEGPKGRFMHPGMELFFLRLGRALLPRGVFRLLFLEADGEKLAGAVAFRFGDTLLVYNSAYEHAHGAVAPGMVLVGEIVRHAIEEGCRAVDLLKGDLGYKYRFGARPRPVRRLLLER